MTRQSSAPWVELLAEIVRGTPKLPDAACRGRAELFISDDPDNTAAAIAICRQCPGLDACQGWAANQRRLVGVVAGQMHEHPADSARSPI